MSIVNLSMDWIQPQAAYKPPREGLLVTSTRANIFNDPPAVNVERVITSGTYDISTTNINLFISSAEITGINPALLPAPGSVPTLHEVGTLAEGTARRVYQYIDASTGLDFRFGLTVHAARGTWSSEPHAFESESMKDPRPMLFWEQFAYLTQPRNKWGIQVRHGFIGDSINTDFKPIRDRDILRIPLGVHPVTAGPGTLLSYFWLYQADDISAAEKF